MTATGRGRAALVLSLVAALVVGVAAFTRWASPHMDVMLETDEADYVRALAYGASANYLGTRERNGVGFVRDVVDEYRRTGWARPFKRDWDADDAAGLRHYHPPPGLYPVGVLASAGVRDERTLRTVPLVTGVAAALGEVWLAWVLLAGVPAGLRASMASVAGLVTAVSPYHVISSSTIGPHAAFSLVSVLALAAMARALQSSGRGWWLAASAGVGVAALTVPYWVLLVPALAWVWWRRTGRAGRPIRALALGLVAALVAALIVWPPFFLAAGFVKPVLLYVSLVMSPPDIAGRYAGDWIVTFLRAHAALAVLLVGGLAGIATSRAGRRPMVPAALFVLGFFLLNLRVSYMKPMYASDVVPALAALAAALAGWALVKAPRSLGLAAAAVMGLTAIASTPSSAASPGEWRAPLAAMNARFAGQRVLVTPRPAGAMVKYYLDRVEVVLDSDHPDDAAALRRDLASGAIGVVLRWGSRTEPRGVVDAFVTGRDADGVSLVGATPVSWWRIAAGP